MSNTNDNRETYNPKVIDRIAAKPDDGPLTNRELEHLFIYEYGELFETCEDGSWL